MKPVPRKNAPECPLPPPTDAGAAGKGLGAAALKRSIGLFGATAIGVGAIIGSGIFIVTGIVAGLAGPALVVSILIAGVIAAASALSIAELGCFLPVEGGTYSFAYRLISPLAGYIAGWIWIFSNIFVGAAVAIGFAQYFVTFIPGLPPKAVAIGICLLFVAINAVGVEELAIVNDIFVVIKILVLAVFVAVGIWFLHGSHYTPLAPQGSYGVLQGAALIFFAYTGFARVTIVAEEVRDPVATIPRSIFLALGISTALYIAVGLVAVGLVGDAALAASASPLATAIGSTNVVWAGPVVTVGALIATGSVLLTTILGISRIAYAMSRNRDLPRILSAVHPRFATPLYAIAVTGACIVAAILLADLALMVEVSTFAMLIYYLIANGAAMKIPWNHRRYPAVVPVMGAMTCCSLILFLTREAWAIGFVGLVAGLAIYAAHKKLGR